MTTGSRPNDFERFVVSARVNVVVVHAAMLWFAQFAKDNGLISCEA